MISKGAQKAGDRFFVSKISHMSQVQRQPHKKQQEKKKEITALTLNVSEQSAR